MKKIIFVVLVFYSTIANAQFSETLSSDRPGQALSGATVGNNVFQIQAGIDFFENTSDFFPSSYFRYGLSEKFELNSGVILNETEVTSFTLGARYRLNNIDSKIQSTLQFSYDFGTTVNNSQFIYILGGSLSENLSYTVNLGLQLERNFEFQNAIYVFNLSYSINNKVGVFLEPFGTFQSGSFIFNIDSGVYYLVNNNFQLDALIGENEGLFVGAGVT